MMQAPIGRTGTVLAIGAHPDDIELLCAGTLTLLHAKGWNVEFATLTPGDCGSTTRTREEISALRRQEAAAAAAVLTGSYRCLECDDVFILYDRPTLLKVIRLIRELRPTIVFAMSPEDYMVDHETASTLVRTACFAAGMRNIDTGSVEPFLSVPALYYLDPMEGKDILGTSIGATTLVDIGSVMETKEQMFLCHESQLDWLKAHHGVAESLQTLRALAAMRGAAIGVRYAEGFRQHRGHAYPQENILKKELGSLVHLMPAHNDVRFTR